MTDGIHTTLTAHGHPDFCVQSSLMLMLPIFNFAEAYNRLIKGCAAESQVCM